MAKAAFPILSGAKPMTFYHETLDGIRAVTPKHQFTVPVDPYLRPGDASSGLLPLIQDQAPGQARPTAIIPCRPTTSVFA